MALNPDAERVSLLPVCVFPSGEPPSQTSVMLIPILIDICGKEIDTLPKYCIDLYPPYLKSIKMGTDQNWFHGMFCFISTGDSSSIIVDSI